MEARAFRRHTLIPLAAVAWLTACGGERAPHPTDAGVPSPDAAPSAVRDPAFPTATTVALRQRLARFLWGDETAAADVRLEGTDAESVGATAAAMMDDARAREGMAAFAAWWWATRLLRGVDRGSELDADLRTDLAEEIHRTFVERVFSPTGRFPDLLLAPTTFVNRRLARLYGMTEFAGDGFREVSYPAAVRKGLAMSVAALTAYSSEGLPSSWPPKRGWLVNQVLTCTQPFESVLPSFVPAKDRPIRSQLIAATASPNCQGCHRVLDEPGFAFIGFDTLGRPLADDLGFPIDSSGHLPQLAGAPAFEDAFDMLERLATAPEVHRCFAQHVLHYALDPRDNQDKAVPPIDIADTLTHVSNAFRTSGLALRTLFSVVARTGAFRAERTFSWD